MTSSHPPRLALGLLQRFLPDNEPLAGDLLEGFAARKSRLWFWRQVLSAIVLQSRQPRDEEHPLGLAGHDFLSSVGRARTVEPRQINLSASPLPDVGGLGLVAFGVLVAVVRPEMLWIFPPAILGGVALGATMAIIRRRAVHSGPAGARWTLLRGSEARRTDPLD